MKILRPLIALLPLLILTNVASAEVVVKDAWARATVPQQRATGVFMQLQSDKEVRLMDVQSTAAGMAGVHEMQMENNVMKMREVLQLTIPAGKNIEFKPGGLHVMLMDLKSQAKEGDIIPLKLIFEAKDKKQQTVEIKVKVKGITATDGKM